MNLSGPTRVGRRATLLALLAFPCLAASCPDSGTNSASPSPDEAALQVTAFGILARPGSTEADPKLAEVLPKLRLLLPGYGFRRLGSTSRRLSAGQELDCPLGDGRSARIDLLDAEDTAGKVRLKLTLSIPGQAPFVDEIITPPNQLVLVDRMLPDKGRLLVGLAAR